MTEEATADEETIPLTSSGAKESYLSVDLLDEGSTDGSSPTLPQPDTEPQTSFQKSKRRKGVKMDSRGTFGVELNIQRSILMHTLAAEYFKCRHFWLFEFQQGLFTMVSSILAFVATTELVENRMKIILTTIVGATTIFVGFLQAMNSLCSYGTRSIMHQSVAIDLRDQKNHLRMLRTQLGHIENKGIQYGADEEEHDEDEFAEGTFESIRDKYEQSLSGCKSSIPIEISEAFDGLRSALWISGTLSNAKFLIGVYGPGYVYEMLLFKTYDIVTAEIMDYPLFPFALPRASETVKKTRASIPKTFQESWELYTDAENLNKA